MGNKKQKDPAFLLYFQDFLLGTAFLTDEQVGVYIRLLCHQADKGHITTHMIKTIARQNWESIEDKFVELPDGNFINVRLQQEMQKRKEYAESRRRNRMGEQHMSSHMNKTSSEGLIHMENENENENIKERGVGKTSHSTSAPSMEEVVEHFKSQGFSEEDGKNFWSHFESVGWEDTRGRLLKNWTARVILWMNQGKQFRKTSGEEPKPSRFIDKSSDEFRKSVKANEERIQKEGKFKSFKDYQPEKKGT